MYIYKIIRYKMLRFLRKTSNKKIPLGRWSTDKGPKEMMRIADLANYDSCGTCGLPDIQPDIAVEVSKVQEKYVSLEDDLIYMEDYLYAPGSFHIYKIK